MKNINVKFISDPFIVKKVLEIPDKGEFIEHLIATPAWAPLISLESINGSEWIKQKALFLKFIKYIPSIDELKITTENVVNKYSDKHKYNPIDSFIISKMTLEIMIQWLFGLSSLELNSNISDNDLDMVVLASIEWKKEIAVKAKGNLEIKSKTVELFLDLILRSKYYDIFKEKWYDPLYYSIILQPFIISPMINIPDIAIYVNKYNTLEEAIFYHHPFPILERYVANDLYINNKLIIKANTQVFIPLDTMTKDLNYKLNSKYLVFGSG